MRGHRELRSGRGVNKGWCLRMPEPPLPVEWRRSVFNGLAQIIVQSSRSRRHQADGAGLPGCSRRRSCSRRKRRARDRRCRDGCRSHLGTAPIRRRWMPGIMSFHPTADSWETVLAL